MKNKKIYISIGILVTCLVVVLICFIVSPKDSEVRTIISDLVKKLNNVVIDTSSNNETTIKNLNAACSSGISVAVPSVSLLSDNEIYKVQYTVRNDGTTNFSGYLKLTLYSDVENTSNCSMDRNVVINVIVYCPTVEPGGTVTNYSNLLGIQTEYYGGGNIFDSVNSYQVYRLNDEEASAILN